MYRTWYSPNPDGVEDTVCQDTDPQRDDAVQGTVPSTTRILADGDGVHLQTALQETPAHTRTHARTHTDTHTHTDTQTHTHNV